MGFNLGNTNIGSLYVGSTKIGSAYLGSTKVYESSVIPPVPTFDEVTIGTQTWMSKNLSYDDGLGGIITKTVNYGNGNITEYYYNWTAAVRIANYISGWHLPIEDEFITLANYAGGESSAGRKLKSKYGWNGGGNGSNVYKFAAFPAGQINSSTWNDKYSYAGFWTATEYSATHARIRTFVYDSSRMSGARSAKTDNFYSVRLVKDS